MPLEMPDVSGPYQLFEPLSPTAYQALKASIADHGCLVPVEVSAVDGAILDGHHRVAACKELGVEYPRIVRGPMTEAESIAHVITLHVHRRHLDRATRAKWIQELNADGWSTRRIADLTGLSQSSIVRELRDSGEPDDSPATVTGTDGRTYPRRRPAPAVFATNTRQQNRARTALETIGPDAPHRVLDIRRAERLARETRNANLRQQPNATLPPHVRIEHTDFRELTIEPASVDLVLTDPPYTTAAMPEWDDFGSLAARWLKPGRFLVAICGQMHLPQALAALTAGGLEYWWSMAMVHSSAEVTQVRGRHLGSRFKLLLVMRAPGGSADPTPWFVDTLTSGTKEKDHHPWQQGAEQFEYIIRALTDPGELVVDPFLGSGTTGVAAVRQGRSIVGAEIDQRTAEVARNRIQTELAQHEGGQRSGRRR